MNTTKLIVLLLSIVFCVTCSSQESKRNESLISLIDSMSQKDAQSLAKARALREEYGMQSEEAKKQDSISHAIQVSNLIETDKILEQYGWPAEDMIGKKRV